MFSSVFKCLCNNRVVTAGLVIATGAGVYTCWYYRAYEESLFYGDQNTGAGVILSSAAQDLTCERIRTDTCYSQPMNTYRERRTENGHKLSGAWRDAARKHIETIILSQGFKPFALSPSAYDLHHVESWHEHVVPQDLHHRITHDIVDESHFIYGIDMDYYLPDFKALFATGRPIAFYTFNPIESGGMDGDVPFTISDDRVGFCVSGGSRWNHKVWDWRNTEDHVGYGLTPFQTPFRMEVTWNCVQKIVWKLIGRVLGMVGINHVTVYKRTAVEVDQAVPHRLFVWLFPAFSYWRLPFISRLRVPEPVRMKYQDPIRPGWNRITHIDKKDGPCVQVNIGRQGAYESLTIPESVYMIALGASTAATVSTLFNGDYSKTQLAVLNQYKLKQAADMGDRMVLGAPGTMDVPPFLPLNAQPYEDDLNWRTISNPLVEDSNLLPCIKRFESLEQTIDYRVNRPMNFVIPPPEYEKYAQEFVAMVVPDNIVGTGIPSELDAVRDQLNNGRQRLSYEQICETVGVEPRWLIDGFLKNEPTMKPNRIISSFADFRFIVMFSRFTLAFRQDILHQEANKHFFYPGRSPIQIARDVVDYCRTVTSPLEGDYSNFDGTVSEWIQVHVGNAAYLRYFHPKYRGELKRFLDNLIHCQARAKRFQYRYDPGPGIKSGSPTTCDINTLINAFIMFCAIRKTNPFWSVADCFKAIGPAFGDDSLFDVQYKQAWTRVVTKLGMKLKVEAYKETQGITFLARVYPKPYDSTTSFQDPLRTMRKLHLTSRNRTVPLADAALDRVTGYLVTDNLTPIIGNYCRCVEKSYVSPDDARRLDRGDQYQDKPYWVVGDSSAWPQDEADMDSMREVMANRLGVSVGTVIEYDNYLGNLPNVTGLLPLVHKDGEAHPYEGCVLPDGTCCPGDEGSRPKDTPVLDNVQSRSAKKSSEPAPTVPGPAHFNERIFARSPRVGFNSDSRPQYVRGQRSNFSSVGRGHGFQSRPKHEDNDPAIQQTTLQGGSGFGRHGSRGSNSRGSRGRPS